MADARPGDQLRSMPWPDAAGQGTLRQQVQVLCSGRAAVYRAQHLHIAARVQAEPGRDPPRHDAGHQGGRLLGVRTAEPEEVDEAAQDVAGPARRRSDRSPRRPP